ncbi:MAG TPA: amidohydrolase family protein [Acidothermaceae bacterium]|nr:amidohydrolase family protein [Acidothermaceae bacterium]
MSRQLSGVFPGTGRIQLTIQHDVIADVRVVDSSTETQPDDELLLPGLLDLQVNGYQGIDFNDDQLTTADVRAVVEGLRAVGVTGFCPTVITGPRERMLAAVRVISSACAQDEEAADAVLGIHLEGPWISAADGARGAHPRDDVRAPDLAELRELTATGDIAILTVAPELPRSAELIAAAVDAGVTVSIGHSAATPDDVRTAAAAGASLSTHLGNGVPLMLPRHPNLIWEQLSDNRLACMMIADGHHLDLATLTVMARAKGAGGWLLVSDVTAIGGMTPGRYRTPVGGLVELDGTGRLRIVGADYLAGAARSLLDGLAWLLQTARLPASEVVSAVSSAPAKVLGRRGGGRGELAPGRRADLVRARWTSDKLTVLETISRGRTVWRADA